MPDADDALMPLYCAAIPCHFDDCRFDISSPFFSFDASLFDGGFRHFRHYYAIDADYDTLRYAAVMLFISFASCCFRRHDTAAILMPYATHIDTLLRLMITLLMPLSLYAMPLFSPHADDSPIRWR